MSHLSRQQPYSPVNVGCQRAALAQQLLGGCRQVGQKHAICWRGFLCTQPPATRALMVLRVPPPNLTLDLLTHLHTSCCRPLRCAQCCPPLAPPPSPSGMPASPDPAARWQTCKNSQQQRPLSFLRCCQFVAVPLPADLHKPVRSQPPTTLRPRSLDVRVQDAHLAVQVGNRLRHVQRQPPAAAG